MREFLTAECVCSVIIHDPPHLNTTGYSLWLELEEQCNLDCLFCYNPWRPRDSGYGRRTMIESAHMLDVITEIMSHLDIVHVTLSGGEPLMYPGLLDVVNHLRRWSPTIGMTTNGRSATRRRLSELQAAGLSQLAVPVHSHIPAVHDRLAGAASWNAAVRALAISQELGLDATMSSVVTRINAAHADGLSRIVEMLGIGRYTANCFHPVGQGRRNQDELAVNPAEFDAFHRAVLERLGPGVDVRVGSPGRLVTEDLMHWQADRIVISPFGDVKLCIQSSEGVLNVQEDSSEEFFALLDQLSRREYAELAEKVDACTCLGRAG